MQSDAQILIELLNNSAVADILHEECVCVCGGGGEGLLLQHWFCSTCGCKLAKKVGIYGTSGQIWQDVLLDDMCTIAMVQRKGQRSHGHIKHRNFMPF